MKKIAIIFLAFAFAASSLMAQGNAKPTDLNGKIKNIKAWYKDIKDNEKKFTVEAIDLSEDDRSEASVYISKLGNDLKTITFGQAEGDCGESNIIFYKDNKAFFILYESACDVENMSTKDINRYYIDNNQLIQFLQGSAKKNIKPGTEEFKMAESMIQDLINDAKKYQK